MTLKMKILLCDVLIFGGQLTVAWLFRTLPVIAALFVIVAVLRAGGVAWFWWRFEI